MTRIVDFFPLWLLVGAFVAFVYPPAILWFLEAGLITPALGLVMLGMGLSLELDDFIRVARRPRAIVLAAILQFTVMPAAGWGVSELLGFPRAFSAGLILVCCCPGGTASNVIAYLARADVPLSVSMTAVSTLLSPILTPLLATWLIGDRVDVEPWGLMQSALLVVLIPVTMGALLRTYASEWATRLEPYAPPTATILIVLIVAAILGANRSALIDAGLPLMAGVAAAHTIGFGLGYLGGLLSGTESGARTISIEVGMQNSGLGVVLARANFVDPLVAVPCALSSVFHSLIGSALASVWSRQSARASDSKA